MGVFTVCVERIVPHHINDKHDAISDWVRILSRRKHTQTHREMVFGLKDSVLGPKDEEGLTHPHISPKIHDRVQDKVPERCPFTIKTVPYPKSMDLFVFPKKRHTSSGDKPLPNIPLPDCFIFFSSYPSVSKDWCRLITTQWKRLKRQQHFGDFLIMEAREVSYAVYRYRGCHICAHALLPPLHTLLLLHTPSMSLDLSRARDIEAFVLWKLLSCRSFCHVQASVM